MSTSKPPRAAQINVPAAMAANLDARRAVGRAASSELSANVRRGGKNGRSFADLLSRLYTVADELVSELELGGDAAQLAKRSEALKSVAKTLPLLQQAERNAKVSAKRKALEELTDDEIAALAKAVIESSSPNQVNARAVVPALAGKTENPISEKNQQNPILDADLEDE